MLYYEDFVDILGEDAPRLLAHSGINSTNEMQKFMETVPKPKSIIELGTYYGCTSVMFASMGTDVVSFDVREYPETKEIMARVYDEKTMGDITFVTVNNRQGIKNFLRGCDYDFAFVDTVHDDYNHVKADWLTVRACCRVLFHDYHFKEVKQLVDEIGGKQISRALAYWEAF
jgi:predicted O-methyltransferase YrrM